MKSVGMKQGITAILVITAMIAVLGGVATAYSTSAEQGVQNSRVEGGSFPPLAPPPDVGGIPPQDPGASSDLRPPVPLPNGPQGTVISVSPQSITLRTRRGETLQVTFSENTAVHWVEIQRPGALGDLRVGDRVRVQGRLDEAGTIQAEIIRILPRGDQ